VRSAQARRPHCAPRTAHCALGLNSAAMKRAILAAAALSLLFATPAKTPPKTSLADRVKRDGFIRVDANSFRELSPKQKQLAYWLSEASIAVDPIIYDQMSRFGLREKTILELIVSHPEGIDPKTFAKIHDFTKLFWGNHGNHNDNTGQKFLPTFTPEELHAAALTAFHHAHSKLTEDQLTQQLEDVKDALFDPNFEPQLTAKNPPPGSDIIQASANNFYAKGVTLADLKDFKDQYPLNSRLGKTTDGKLVEDVYRVGGRYSAYLGKANEYLHKAATLADPKQAKVINALIRYYETGDPQAWLDFGVLWVQNDAPVDFANGFIEVYRDARGAKGTSQSFVSVTDQKMTGIMRKLANAAQYFEKKAPWRDEFKNPHVNPPVAKAVETVIETGDFAVTIVGDNLPNESEIHDKYGTKNFMFSGSQRAINSARGTSRTTEFAYSDEEKRRATKYGNEASDLLTGLHEIIGHGSGKTGPKVTGDPGIPLKEYYSTLEEARADLSALWNVWDPKLKELGVISNQEEVAKAMYDGSARVALTQLATIRKGDTIEEDHARDRQLIALYIMDKVPGSIEWTKKNGKTYIHVVDYQKMRQGAGMLLAELMRIKGEGDYDAIKALVDKYAVHFDPKLRDEVVARYDKLNLPTYLHGINVTLHMTKDGAVTMTGPGDFTKQRLNYASMYDAELAP
jgi:dipeptidyl-peptidase III